MDAVTEFAETHSWLFIDVVAVLIPALVASALAWLFATSLRDILKAFSWFAMMIQRRGGEPADTPVSSELQGAVQPFEEPRLAREVQWSRVTRIVSAGFSHVRAMEKHHGDASRQLDAALYGLQRLNGELRDLSPIREAAAPEHIRVRWARARLIERKKDDRTMAA